MRAPHGGGFRRPAFPLPVRAGIGAWRALQRLGLARVSLEEQSLLAEARRSSGLERLGDESFREPLGRLLAAAESEAALHPLGRLILRQSLVRALINRLRLEALSELHPAVAEQPVEVPVFILGLQRTGTTLLHRLLTCDPRLRPLRSWEALNPAPFPRGPVRGGRDPRIRVAETAERGLRYLAPRFFAIHPVEAHAPEEDVLLIDASFVSPTADATLYVPSYSAWLRSIDHRPAYRVFRRLLQLLLWQRPGRYLGKTPHHLEFLDALLAVFPDARIIQTHRDPARVVASYCSMMGHGRAMFSDRVDAVELGRQIRERTLRAVTRSMQVRGTVDAAFADVAYADLVADPIKQVRRIYDFLGLPLPPETEAAMERWLAANPQGRHGVHRYRLEDFGLDRAELEPLFEPYRRRFGVASEAAPA